MSLAKQVANTFVYKEKQISNTRKTKEIANIIVNEDFVNSEVFAMMGKDNIINIKAVYYFNKSKIKKIKEKKLNEFIPIENEKIRHQVTKDIKLIKNKLVHTVKDIQIEVMPARIKLPISRKFDPYRIQKIKIKLRTTETRKTKNFISKTLKKYTYNGKVNKKYNKPILNKSRIHPQYEKYFNQSISLILTHKKALIGKIKDKWDTDTKLIKSRGEHDYSAVLLGFIYLDDGYLHYFYRTLDEYQPYLKRVNYPSLGVLNKEGDTNKKHYFKCFNENCSYVWSGHEKVSKLNFSIGIKIESKTHSRINRIISKLN